VISTVVLTVVMLVNSLPSRVLPVLFMYFSSPGYATLICILSLVLLINIVVVSPVMSTVLVSPSTVRVNSPSVSGTLFCMSFTLTLIVTFPLVLFKISTVVVVGILLTS